jgi:hypothetical protein
MVLFYYNNLKKIYYICITKILKQLIIWILADITKDACITSRLC